MIVSMVVAIVVGGLSLAYSLHTLRKCEDALGEIDSWECSIRASLALRIAAAEDRIEARNGDAYAVGYRQGVRDTQDAVSRALDLR